MPLALAAPVRAPSWRRRQLGASLTPGGTHDFVSWLGKPTTSQLPSAGLPSCQTSADQDCSHPYETPAKPEQWNPALTRDDCRALGLPATCRRKRN